MSLPYSRVVNVTLTRNDSFTTRRGFGVPIYLTSTSVAGELDASNLTKVYGSIDEVSEDFVATDDFYKAAEVAFSQNPAPLQVKAAWYDSTTVTTAALLKSALDDIVDVDNEWYWIVPETALRDTALLDGAVEWVEARRKQLFIDSNDVNMENAADTTNIAARHKNTVERTSVFYHTDAGEYIGFALAAKLGTYNFDEANSAYTSKFKNLAGVSNLGKPSAVVQAITGFTPALGQSVATGHLANTYVDIGGQNFLTEGSTLKLGVFIDEVHATDYIISRTEEETLSILLNNARVPMTDQGMTLLASAAKTVMSQSRRAGLIAEDINPETGDYESSVVIDTPSVFDIPESQRKQRIAPEIPVTFRYAGAVHYTTIKYNMSF